MAGLRYQSTSFCVLFLFSKTCALFPNNCPHIFSKKKMKQMWDQRNNCAHLGLHFLLLLSSRHLTQLLARPQPQVCSSLKCTYCQKGVRWMNKSSPADCVHRFSPLCGSTPRKRAGTAATTRGCARTSSRPGRRYMGLRTRTPRQTLTIPC